MRLPVREQHFLDAAGQRQSRMLGQPSEASEYARELLVKCQAVAHEVDQPRG